MTRRETGAADDAELLALLRQGQAAAYEQLMRRYNRLLFRAARGIVEDDADAQDAVQETYLRAFLSLGTFRGESSLATWLVRIAINQSLGQQRKRGRLVPWHDDPAGEEAPMGDQQAMGDGGEGLSAEAEASRNQLRRSLEQAIDLLPPIYRCVFIFRAVQGLSVEDCAEALQVSGDVVKTRYLRARAMLRDRLAGTEAALAGLHDFQGRRCDEVVAHVLARLRECGAIRDQ